MRHMSSKHKKERHTCLVESLFLLPPRQFRSSSSDSNGQIDEEEEDDEKDNNCFMKLEKYFK